jgi:hypothetical protein
MLDLAVARARKQAELARTPRLNGDNRHAIAPRARAFHALAKADGIDPWDPDLLYRWSLEHLHTHAERHCARFILAQWNQTDYDEMDLENSRRLGHFEALEAITDWDHAHRAVFAIWTADPWWP